MTPLRRSLILPVVLGVGLVWVGVPSIVAAGLALDRPAWSHPEIDRPHGSVDVDEMFWWPPGRRYEWRGQNTGETIVRIDPWDPTAIGHVWTGVTLGGTGLLTLWIWTGRRPRLVSESKPHA